ncbi:DUF2877 domain-containing protein [Staphylococcus sp. 17KM0847]|uniref:DUF2877 domain-containing protein n=1 Tax=Staphylococcus sp. 17KM0847 TaxID=2583989 RepID=UPI0015DC4E4D|nr:DUF2877 domain-containing protein [Staphylococcus sp. 17KM0847]QLK85381.1 DUF2877 domain-containing protein [Staphylococcus sp. 17KM0847]
MICHAQSMGNYAHDYLKAPHLVVHSIFKKGFNIINQDNRLIFIGTAENGLFPFGINIDEQTKKVVLDRIKVGQSVLLRNNCLYFNEVILNLNCNIIQFTKPEYYQLNFESDIKKIDFSHYETTDFKRRNIQLLMDDLKAAQDKGMLKYFIGRGNGLTPTGDDILVGMLLVHTIKPFISSTKLTYINTLLKEDCTTQVSKQFLQLAIEGIFSSRLTDLFDATNVAINIERLLNVGSSSGKDTAYGIFSAL